MPSHPCADCGNGESFKLDLRIATMPVVRIREAGYSILAARYRVSGELHPSN